MAGKLKGALGITRRVRFAERLGSQEHLNFDFSFFFFSFVLFNFVIILFFLLKVIAYTLDC